MPVLRGEELTYDHVRRLDGARAIAFVPVSALPLNNRFGYGGPEVTYKGDPSVASIEIGQAFREVRARDCLEEVEAVTSGRAVAADVRSIASDHAVIQPGFLVKAGLAVAAACAVAAWAF